MVILLSWFGVVALMMSLVPVVAISPILLYIGMLIGAQAFQETPKSHAPAIVLALVPHVAAWGKLQIDNALAAAGTSVAAVGVEKLGQSGILYEGLSVLGGGAILSSLILASVAVFVIERQFLRPRPSRSPGRRSPSSASCTANRSASPRARPWRSATCWFPGCSPAVPGRRARCRKRPASTRRRARYRSRPTARGIGGGAWPPDPPPAELPPIPDRRGRPGQAPVRCPLVTYPPTCLQRFRRSIPASAARAVLPEAPPPMARYARQPPSRPLKRHWHRSRHHSAYYWRLFFTRHRSCVLPSIWMKPCSKRRSA